MLKYNTVGDYTTYFALFLRVCVTKLLHQSLILLSFTLIQF